VYVIEVGVDDSAPLSLTIDQEISTSDDFPNSLWGWK